MPPDENRAHLIALVGEALVKGDTDGAKRHLSGAYPFVPVQPLKRRLLADQAMRVFVRDGFVDRYFGTRLVFPGMLRALSALFPEDFPYHPNWKMSVCHIAYWELAPTIDHVVPIARGGTDDESNWVTTSQLRNSIKANWTLEDLGWQLKPPGSPSDWDGLTRTFIDLYESRAELSTRPHLAQWYRAAQSAVAKEASSPG